MWSKVASVLILILIVCISMYFGGHGLTYSFFTLILLMLGQAPTQRCMFLSKKYERAVLVTGCDSGFGYRLAKTLDSMGFVVFAGCLSSNGQGAQTLLKEGSRHLKLLQLDVTRDEDVRLAKAFVEANLPEKGLWAVVNNAGISDWGETEWNSIEDYQKMVDINLFGSIRTSIAFLPLVRASKGRMVFVSSIFAFFNCLSMGAYSVSKRGLEAFADCLRVELSNFDVKVSIIQPGNFGPATNIRSKKTTQEIWDKLDDERKVTFSRSYIEFANEYFQSLCSAGFKDSRMVIDAMVHALNAAQPKSHYLLVSTVEWVFFLVFPLLPTFIKDAIFTYTPIYHKRREILSQQKQ
ncbi:D-beta-hydroxybutyrate dehydrogenase, mitochondrial-like [Astyanax mexicanus]|uniref:D-beta-hydroxybutyrate dehydrogenase, mitochondrial-like n=2 Tax=Astyanax mexicanus TaxID=7994 RepID=A0A8B9JF22_ASTMX|nr:D-beta-hydroxybutyrate dehydrogenase, mitochondrial-like [Astyanax mexicanus]